MTIFRKSTSRFKRLRWSLALSLLMPLGIGSNAYAQTGDKGSSAIPDKVTDLDGMTIDYDHYKDYVTTERPWDNDKMYLLYNVGTGQFLNVGGYWGTHAALSDVPRPFWLQRRNEKKVAGQWSYKRYPESINDNKGLFVNDFFNLTSLQVGSVERSAKTKAPHVTYNHVRYVSNDGKTVKNIFPDNYPINGEDNVMRTISDIYADNGYLEAQINMSNCKGTSSGNMETLITFGEDIAHWDIKQDDGTTVYQNNLFIYGFKDASGYHLRIQAVDNYYKDATHKTGDEKTPITVGSDGIVNILIKRNHVIVNDVECLPRNTSNYESPIKSFLNLTELQVGSTQGNQQSYATYNYVTLTKTSIYDNDPTHIIRPNVACNGREFVKTFSGSLGDQTINASADLSTCNPTPGPDGKNLAENILSIGTDIANWYTKGDATSNNIHIYYNGSTLEADAVNNDYPGKPNQHYQWTKTLTTAARAASGTNISVKFNKLGLFINGELVFGPENEIVAYLLKNAAKIEVGSKQGNRSYATYQNVELVASSENVVTPGYKGDGNTKFGESYTGNLQNKEIVADLDLSQCTVDNENILSIGDAIDKWGTDAGEHNIHFYYPTTQKGDNKAQYIQVDPAAAGNTYRYFIKIGSDRKIRLVLNSKGLFMNGVRYDKIYSDDTTFMTTDIMKHLLNNATEIQVGSKEGNGRSLATYNQLTVKEYVEDTDPNVIAPGTACEGVKFGKTFDGTLADKTITAVIDLTNCQKGKNENILSIGNDISQWGYGNNKSVSDAANLHIYYNANNSYATYQFASSAAGRESNPQRIAIGDDKKLTITWKDGVLTANDNPIADQLNVLSQLSTSAKEIQVGSHEGDNRSHATYELLTVETTGSASSAKAHGKAKAARAAESQADVTYIYKDKVGDNTKFPTDLTQKYDINFANDDYIEADIDLSTCQKTYENILSIGDAIDKWGQGDATNAHNLHIYLLNNDGTNYNLYVVYVNKDHSNDLKRAFTVTKNSDGKAILHLKLSKDGLEINKKNMYPDIDPMPIIGYDPKKAGDIVRFKFTTDMIPVIENDHYVIDDSGSGIYVSNNGYIYTTESRTDRTMPLFITSRFNQEQTASNNEDAYFAWAPYLENNKKWGTIGVFADRSLPQNSAESTTEQSIAYSQWYFEPIAGYENPTYKIYLKMKNVKRHERKAKDDIEYPSESGNFYLQATTSHIYGNHLENYFGGYDTESGDNSQLTSVDALPSTPEIAENSYWRVFNIAEYHKLFGAANSELNSMLDLTFSLRDPDFTRESYELSNWQMAGGLTGKVRIGYDQYSKKTTTDRNYSDDDNMYDIADGKGGYTQRGNSQYQRMKNLLNNHARYMGVDVRNGGNGEFYQDTELRFPGWYAITCGGLSNVGAKLFVRINGSSSSITQPLHVLTDEEKAFFNKPSTKYPNTTDCTRSMWPFDEYDSNGNMPMYNALVAINDKQVNDGKDVDKYKTQVAFYIDPSLVGTIQNEDGTLTTKTATVRFGIDIPSNTTVATADQWTVFDNFHLQFGGKSVEPNLILDEDSTTLDYLDRTIHTFDSRPMHLHRTFQANNWNTLVLPVSLTKQQFTDMLGTDAQLAKLDRIEDTSLIFLTETEDANTGEYLRAYQPYIVKTAVKEGKEPEYTATLYNKADGGKTSVDVTSPSNHFYVADVTLEPETKDEGTGVREYDFAHSQKCNYKVSDDLTWAYVMKDSHTATEEGNDSRQANIFGTLCKTYTTTKDSEGNDKNEMIAGRPTLQDGKSYYMSDGSTIKRRGTKNPYGLKGFRCWFTYEEGTEAQGAKPFTISIDGVSDPTSIEDLQRADGITVVSKYAHAIYNLGGQKVATTDQIGQLPAGIYIVDGKKYIVNK